MRICLILLLSLLGFQPLFAQRSPFAVPPQQDMEQQLIKNLKKKFNLPAQCPFPDSFPSAEALQKLKGLQNRDTWEHISWKDFLKLNERAKERELCSCRLDTRFAEKASQCPVPIPWEEFLVTTPGYPDYEKLLQNEKLIYIAESNNHDTKSAPQEVAKILRAVRKINPTAKILLAAEFARWFFPLNEINLLQEHLEYYSSCCGYFKSLTPEKKAEYCQLQKLSIEEVEKHCQEFGRYLEEEKEFLAPFSSAPLLKKARDPFYFVSNKEYAPVSQTADEQRIDLLALDDHVIETTQQGDIGVKVGKFWVEVPKKVSIPQITSDREEDLSNLLKVSSWGVFERTRDWAQRIKAVLPEYDVVLVYAGDGHLDFTYFTDLQPLVGAKPFMNISLSPLESLPPEIQEQYTKRDKVAEENGYHQDGEFAKELEKRIIEESLVVFEKVWEENTPPFWILADDRKEETFLMQNKDKITQEWLDDMTRCSPEVTSTKDILVVLPAE